MQITLTNTGKRFNRDWIFRHLTYTFSTAKKYAITGPNGSGKSTLLQVLASASLHNEGNVQYHDEKQQIIPPEKVFEYVSIAAPYLDVVEEMTALEFLTFHHALKPLQLPITEILQIVQLQTASNKQIRYFSSGMKQRLKLAQAFFSKSPILLLDEPTTNLDATGISLYQDLIAHHTHQKLVIISSNDIQEYNCCEAVLSMANYK